MKTIAQQLGIKEFPFEIRDKNGNIIYYETSNEYWAKLEYDSNGNCIYSENSDGYITDNRPKPCEASVVESVTYGYTFFSTPSFKLEKYEYEFTHT